MQKGCETFGSSKKVFLVFSWNFEGVNSRGQGLRKSLSIFIFYVFFKSFESYYLVKELALVS